MDVVCLLVAETIIDTWTKDNDPRTKTIEEARKLDFTTENLERMIQQAQAKQPIQSGLTL